MSIHNIRVKEFRKWLNCLPESLWDKLWFIPIRANSKTPETKKGESWLDEKYKLSISDVEKRLLEGKNVGFVATNDTMIVYDIDIYHIKDDKIKEDVLNMLPKGTLRVRTPSGGEHRYYFCEDLIRNGDGKGKYRNTAEIRAEKRYVLVPGSVVKNKMYIVETELLPSIINNDMIFKEFKQEEYTETEDLQRSVFEQFKNKYGWGLDDIVVIDFKLWVLLEKLHPEPYPSISEADLATITKLKFWEFDKHTIFDIMRVARARDKLRRDDYLERTYSKAKSDGVISDYVDVEVWNPKYSSLDEAILDRVISKDFEFNLNRLKKTSWIRKYVKTMSEFTDAYIEYHISSALALLSITLRRRVEIHLKPTITYPNLWFLNFGLSTISRKTTSLKLAQDVLFWAGLENYLLSDDFSPEALVESLSQNSQRVFMKDEVAEFFTKIKKSYGLGLDALFSALYSNPKKYHRKLRKEEFTIENPYLVVLSDSVPSSVLRQLENNDIDSGFIPRFLIVYPERDKEIMLIKNIDENEEEKRMQLAQFLKELDSELTAFCMKYEKVKVVFTHEAINTYNQYYIQKINELKNYEVFEKESFSAVLGRILENVVKLAVIVHFSYTKVLRELKVQTEIVIDEDDVKDAIYLAEMYYFYAQKFIRYVISNIETNIVEKVANIIRKYGKIERHLALRYSRLKAKEFEEALNTLCSRKDVYVIAEKTKGRTKEVLYWVGK